MLADVTIVLIIAAILVVITLSYAFYRGRKNLALWASHGCSFRSLKFKYVKLAQILCGLYALTVTFNKLGNLGVFGGVRDPETGWIQSPEGTQEEADAGIYKYTSFINADKIVTRSVVALNADQMVLLAISRFSGFSMYPVLVLVMFTKYRATQAFFDKTPLGVFFIQDTHALHVFSGWYILFDSVIHTFCHCLRWINQGNFHLLWSNPMGCNPSGITGLIVILSTFIIVLPMSVFKKYFKFEMRKYAHYFFWVFCIAMTFHAPFWALPNAGFCRFIFPILIGWYALDATYVKLFMSERIDTVNYRVLDSGVELSMPVSKRFQKNLHSGGYGYVMAPWVDRHQWHAFSIYENPLDKTVRHMFMAKVGDWTTTVHEKTVETDTTRPLWLCGPFPSPYNNCANFDNMICVASGVGITPALSAIENYRASRRVNLIWAVRDPSMLVFFLENAKLDVKAMNLVFYTGKDPLPDQIESYNLSHDAHLEIIKSRPNIGRLIPNIINYFENPDSDYHKYGLWRKSVDYDEDPEQGNRFSNVSWMTDNDAASRPSSTKRAGSSALPHLSISSFTSSTKRADSSALGRISEASTRDGEVRESGVTSESPSEALKKEDDSGNTFESHSEALKADTVVLLKKKAHPVGRKNSTIFGIESTEHRKRHTLISTTSGKRSGKASAVGQPKVWEENEDARAYVESGIPKNRHEAWGLLYCGGRNPLLTNLVKESKDLNIPLHEEAFDW